MSCDKDVARPIRAHIARATRILQGCRWSQPVAVLPFGVVADTGHLFVKATAGVGASAAGADVRRRRRVDALDGFVRVLLLQRAPSGVGRYSDERRLPAALKDAVIGVKRAVHLGFRRALERLDEALAEVVAQESVQQWIQHAVGVAHDGDHLEQLDAPAGHVARVGERQRHLEDPVGQPADDVHGDDRQHHLGDTTVRAPLHFGAARRTGRLQPEQDEGVEDADERNWNGEAEQQRVPDERLVGGDQLSVGPDDRTRSYAAARLRRRVQDDRQHGEQRQRPHACAHDPRHERRPVRYRPDRVTHGHVAVSAHDRQREDAREPVDGRLNIEEFAENVAEDPRS